MTDTVPGASPDRAVTKNAGPAERATTLEAEVQAKGAAEAAAMAEARETGEAVEADLQAMTDFVMGKADLDAGTCFGIAIPEGMLPIELAKMLCGIDDDGEFRERHVPLRRDQRVPFTDEAELGYDAKGDKTAWIKTEVGTFTTELPGNPTDREMGDILRTVQLRTKLHEINIAHIFFPDVHALEYGGGPIDVHPHHHAITEKFLGLVVGNRALAGNNLLSQADLDKIPYLMQFHDRKGDYGIADLNPDQIVDDYRAQSIIDRDGALNWLRFEELVMANRANLYSEANFAAKALDKGA